MGHLDEHVSDFYKKTLSNSEIIIKPEKSWKFIKEKNIGRDDLVAFSEDDKKITYGEMYEQWDTVARVLSGYDIYRENNSRILVLMPNLTKTGIYNYGADITGAVVDYIDPTSSYEKIRKYVENEKITDIFALDLLLAQNVGNKVEELKKDFNLNNIMVYRDFYMNSLMPKKIKLVSSVLGLASKFSKYVTRYEDAVKNTRNSQIKYDTTNGDKIDFITHTSGTTTGIGKPIPLTDHNRNSLVNEYKLAGFEYEPGMKMMHFIPYFAGYGTVNTAHLGLSNGVELQQIPLFSPTEFAEYVIKYKSNIVVATTPCWLSLVKNPKYQNTDLSFLTLAATGGSPTSIEDEIKINSFLASHGAKCKLIVGYGMSEFGGCVITDNDKYNTYGKTGVPLPGVDVKIRNSDGMIYDYSIPNIEGEALIHSETMTKGILDGKQIVPTVEIDGKKYISTHDLMKFDEYGQAQYLGRTDGIFQRYDGYNVQPLNIENFLKCFDEIADCAVIWQKDEERNGNIPKVVIQLKESIDDKKYFIKNIIEKYFLTGNSNSKYVMTFRDMPHIWSFVEKLPKNTMEKTELYKLLSDEIEEESYKIVVEEDNAGIKNYEIQTGNQKVK